MTGLVIPDETQWMDKGFRKMHRINCVGWVIWVWRESRDSGTGILEHMRIFYSCLKARGKIPDLEKLSKIII